MREKILEVILDNEKEFISGEELSKKLGISRTAIWKHIRILRSQGYNIESVNKKGYRLVDEPTDLLNPQNIYRNLKTKFIGKNVLHFETIDSTNDYAKKIGNELRDGSVIISEEQTKGKGRLGRVWESKAGEGIWMSIILKPNIIPNKAPFITLIAGASIVKALNILGVDAKIKWPNDITINNKKLSGILTELSAEIERVNYIVVGIGMNVKDTDFEEELQDKATSLYKENYNVSRVDIVKEILCQFEKLYLDYIEKDDKKEVLDICRQYSAIINKEIYVIKNDQKELVDCIGINEEGNLIIKNKDGKLEEIMSGEVSIRGVKGYV
ncbi:MAG: biotin--[acetyl-CoA-carboxylase] ligase [Clostridiales bacterium]|uniref:biotin--[acetyl-CoA-carboxylase] ligase n=2 Tax=Terrisporobacter sp. TaxID=1965305 RepID=UPI002A3C8139|nr:biotin--[acetyl-CoA-carboxylase] ligase [Terrisporobacter sp.]MDD5879581.1 biotin--[acetyl-CoA-carboxylase] ligase [Clostridiales bacterium]MDD7755143.1 biotin--[acetyl-CoA-carboxylase] ligase [Clostridiales bacterium]MDY4135827.1 biotin--[acetyl-CoA-carboxylase] ligase [Terrisporobacter sp.]